MRAFRRRNISSESGQSLVELAISAGLLFTLMFATIDFARAIYYVEVMKNLTAEGSSLASRGSSNSDTAARVVNDAGNNLNIGAGGCVYVTTVFNTGSVGGNPLQVSQQASLGACSGISSKVGCAPPARGCGPAALPSEAAAALQSGQNLYVTEVYYSFSPVTPVGALLKDVSALPAQLYDAAYY
jgi:hypothetical protein